MSLLDSLKDVISYVPNHTEDAKLLYDYLYKSPDVILSDTQVELKNVEAVIRLDEGRINLKEDSVNQHKRKEVVKEDIKRKEIKKEIYKEEVKRQEIKNNDKPQWYYMCKEGCKPFDPVLSEELETAFSNGITEYQYIYNETEYKVNLKEKKRTNLAVNETTNIIRAIGNFIDENQLNFSEEIKLPKKPEVKKLPPANNHASEELIRTIIENYSIISVEEPIIDSIPEWKPCIKTRLTEYDPEYKGVIWRFTNTLHNASLSRYIIVERLTNVRAMYFFKKTAQRISSERGIPLANITMQLFHGTRLTKPEDIYNGYDATFDPKFSRGGTWGRGAYFATRASYSNNYAHTKGTVKQMFLADVIIGRYHDFGAVGNNGLVYPPEEIPGKAKRYDSIKANSVGTEIYVVYDLNMAYPTYLISYSSSPIYQT